LSLCTTAHPLYIRFAKIIGASFLKRQCDRTLGEPPDHTKWHLEQGGPSPTNYSRIARIRAELVAAELELEAAAALGDDALVEDGAWDCGNCCTGEEDAALASLESSLEDLRLGLRSELQSTHRGADDDKNSEDDEGGRGGGDIRTLIEELVASAQSRIPILRPAPRTPAPPAPALAHRAGSPLSWSSSLLSTRSPPLPARLRAGSVDQRSRLSLSPVEGRRSLSPPTAAVAAAVAVAGRRSLSPPTPAAVAALLHADSPLRAVRESRIRVRHALNSPYCTAVGWEF
jgi:hypothetical protein